MDLTLQAKDNKKKKTFSRKTKQRIFIVVMLSYPVLQFILFFGYVNFDSILLTFKSFSWTTGKNEFSGLINYITLFDKIKTDKTTQRMLINSLLYMPITCFIILPLSLMFSFFLYKKVPFSGFFRVVYFLPSILPIVVLTMVFSFLFDSSFGPVTSIVRYIYDIFNIDAVPPSWFGSYPNNQIMIFVYCIWVGLGFNIILLTSAITRIPPEIIEYGKIEGITMFDEFFKVVIPLIWPTITTVFMLGITSIFTVLMQPLLLTPSSSDTYTISLIIYDAVNTGSNLPYAATLGLVATLIGLPLILGTRKIMNHFFTEIEY
jgi:ABC-type sugar transport system permease subunit